MRKELVWFNNAEVEVHFDFEPEERSARDQWGLPREPDIDASVDIREVFYQGLNVSDLFDEEDFYEIEELVWESLKQCGEQ